MSVKVDPIAIAQCEIEYWRDRALYAEQELRITKDDLNLTQKVLKGADWILIAAQCVLWRRK